MRNKKAKTIKKVLMESLGNRLPWVDYQERKTKKLQLVVGPEGKLVPQQVEKVTVYMGECIRQIYRKNKQMLSKGGN